MRLILAFLAVFLFVPLLAINSGADDSLNDEQSYYLKKMESFMEKMEEKVFSTAIRLNGKKETEKKSFSYETADYDVGVTRGDVIQKCGVMKAKIKKALPLVRIPDPIAARYLQIDVFPKTPLVGMLHIAVNFGYFKDGNNNISGTMDITPGTVIKEDEDFVRDELDKLFKKHGEDISSYREPFFHGEHTEILKASCAGVSFYRFPKPGLPQVNEKNFDLVTKSAETLFDAYIKLIEKHKDGEFTEEDIVNMFDMRKRWFEKEFFWDRFPSTGTVPYEVWSMQDLPPEVRF